MASSGATSCNQRCTTGPPQTMAGHHNVGVVCVHASFNGPRSLTILKAVLCATCCVVLAELHNAPSTACPLDQCARAKEQQQQGVHEWPHAFISSMGVQCFLLTEPLPRTTEYNRSVLMNWDMTCADKDTSGPVRAATEAIPNTPTQGWHNMGRPRSLG